MAKLRGKAKAAFLRRMARGRAAARRRKAGPSRSATRTKARARRKLSFKGTLRPSKKTPGVVRMRLYQNPIAAIANPGGLVPYRGPRVIYTAPGGPVRKRKKRKTTMAKKRRKRSRTSTALTRRKRRRTGRVTRRRRPRRILRSPRARARYYRKGRRGVVYYNPGRKRRHRRNPGGLMGGIKSAFAPFVAGFLTSGVTAVLDKALANKSPMVRNLSKVGLLLVVSATLGRSAKYQRAATAATGAIAASIGYPLFVKMAGGISALNGAEAVEQLGNMAADEPGIGALLEGGVGALLEGPSDVAESAMDYEGALYNMAGGADDDE